MVTPAAAWALAPAPRLPAGSLSQGHHERHGWHHRSDQRAAVARGGSGDSNQARVNHAGAAARRGGPPPGSLTHVLHKHRIAGRPAAGQGRGVGSWLMRIAQFYGLSLNALLSRVGAANPSSGSLPHWFGLRPGVLGIAPLARALRVQPRQLSTVAPPGCRPHLPTELGACSACLENAAVAQQPRCGPELNQT